MTTFLALSGAVFWVLFLLLGTAIVVQLLLLVTPLGRWVQNATLFPYSSTFSKRLIGIGVTLLGKFKLPLPVNLTPDLATALRSVKLKEMQDLRDVILEMDRLPTIEKGKAALGLTSLFETLGGRVHKIPSPYTHPLQYPGYYLPGVPAKTFYDPAEFEWVRPLEEAFPVIRQELLDLLSKNGAGFKGYMTEYDQRQAGWNTFNFFFFGKKFEENCALCPKTTAILESLPRFEKDHIMFSALNPHAHIPRHTGPMNGIIRGHLPLIVPPGCYIRVGDDERTWKEGKVLVFDDSFVHEVWNHSDYVRIVLFMNFWHPCFSDQEVRVLERFRTAYERNPLAKLHADNQAAERGHDLELKQLKPAL